MRRHNLSTIIILTLIAIGLFSAILKNLAAFIIPVAVFGIVYYLYKYPPQRYRGGRSNSTSHRRTTSQTKTAKFRVIQGNKQDDDKDDLPKYH